MVYGLGVVLEAKGMFDALAVLVVVSSGRARTVGTSSSMAKKSRRMSCRSASG
jgi:hypothetical protein